MEEPIQMKKEKGMPDNLKAGMEDLSGIDISDVRVHHKSDKPAEFGAFECFELFLTYLFLRNFHCLLPKVFKNSQ